MPDKKKNRYDDYEDMSAEELDKWVEEDLDDDD
jgi:hypothetical protein